MPKMILADKLITALIAEGIISHHCHEFIIHAKAGDLVTLTEGTYLDDAILQVAHGIKTTEIPAEAHLR